MLLLALDAMLWATGLLLDVSADSRFRLLSGAVILLYVPLGLVIGFGWGSAIWFGGMWVYAILAGLGRSPAV